MQTWYYEFTNMSYISWCWHVIVIQDHTLCNRRVCKDRLFNLISTKYNKDSITAKNIAKRLLDNPKEFAYVRLDRDELPNIYDELDTHTGQIRGVYVHNPKEKDFKLLISHGKMSHVCKQISDTNDNFAFADILKSSLYC